MAKKHGRGRGRGPRLPRTTARPTRPAHSAEDQQLFQGLRQALRADDPLDLLATVSGFLEVADPRRAQPFGPDVPRPALDELVESFIGTPYAETTAALTVLQALCADDAVTARIGAELATRRHPMPAWLSGLVRAGIDPDVWFLTHVLGDGDDYLFGVTLPSGYALSALVYVDHNLGSVVKDAFVVPESLEDLAIKLGTTMDDPDQSLTRTDPAAARAALEAAIDTGAHTYPPLESESWPMCRPLVEWMVRLLPSGGAVPERKEWSEQETVAIADAFFASPYGTDLGRDERDLLETVMWFGTDYSTGDPLRWSPVTVEMLMDWVPRKVLAEPSYLVKLPDLVRAFIRYAHDREGIRDDLTGEALAAIDHFEPEYLRVVRNEGPQGGAALVANLFGESDLLDDDLGTGQIVLGALDRRVGGRQPLLDLDTFALPDEPFEWAGIADDIRPVVQEILDACDRCADELLDAEHRTAMRRFLARAAVRDPAMFRRKASRTRGAAAVAWVICRANDTVGTYRSGYSVQELLAWFGVKGSVSQRARPFLRANGVDPDDWWGPMELGTPDLLTSLTRAELIEVRDRYL